MKLLKFFILTLTLAATTTTMSLDASKKRKTLNSEKDSAQPGKSSKVRKVGAQEKSYHLCSKPIEDKDGAAETSCCKKIVHNKCIRKACAACELNQSNKKRKRDTMLQSSSSSSSSQGAVMGQKASLEQAMNLDHESDDESDKEQERKAIALSLQRPQSSDKKQVLTVTLPDDLWAYIFPFLHGRKAFAHLPLVSRSFNNIIHNPLSIASFDFSGYFITQHEVKKLPYPYDISHKQLLIQTMVKKIISHYKIQKLTLADESITDDILRIITLYLKNLEELSLNDTIITNEGLKELASLTTLKSLKLFFNRFFMHKAVTPVGLRHLASLTQLQNLDLGYIGISDDDLKFLAHFPKLRRLSLEEDYEITDNGLATLAQLPNAQYIEDLSLKKTKITDDGLKSLKHFSKLRHLNLKWNQITDKGLAILAQLPNAQYIEDLNLSETNISDDGLKSLTHFPKLRRLNLRNNKKITDNGLTILAQLSNAQYIEDLNLSETKITDNGLKSLKHFPRLRRLNLAENYQITGNGLTILAQLPNAQYIEDLNLLETNIFNYGLKSFTFDRFPNLKNLNLYNIGRHSELIINYDIKDKALEKLLISCPKLQYLATSYRGKKYYNIIREEYNQNEIIALREKLLQKQAYAQASAHASLMEGGK